MRSNSVENRKYNSEISDFLHDFDASSFKHTSSPDNSSIISGLACVVGFLNSSWGKESAPFLLS